VQQQELAQPEAPQREAQRVDHEGPVGNEHLERGASVAISAGVGDAHADLGRRSQLEQLERVLRDARDARIAAATPLARVDRRGELLHQELAQLLDDGLDVRPILRLEGIHRRSSTLRSGYGSHRPRGARDERHSRVRAAAALRRQARRW
jgi:hypothetical protein